MTRPDQLKQFLYVFLLSQSAQIDQHHIFRLNTESVAQFLLFFLILWRLETAHLDTGRNHGYRRIHTVSLEEIVNLLSRHDRILGLVQDPFGKMCCHIPPESCAGRIVMGIVLIHCVICVYQRCIAFLGNVSGRQKCGKLTLAVHHIRLPLDQFPDKRARRSCAHPGIGIDLPDTDGRDVCDITLFITVMCAGQGQDADLMTAVLQPLCKI